MAHPEIGHRILMRLIGDLAEVAVPETQPRMEGNQMHTILTAKKGAKAAPKAASPRPAEVETK
jgi:translation initiation factor IF-3